MKYSVALRAPVLVGAKVTITEQLAPGWTASWLQSPISENSFASNPPVPTALNVRAVLPSFVTVTVCGALLVPTFWLANFKLAGDTFAAVAIPASSMNCGFDEALSLSVINPVCLPAEVGLNIALIVHLAPAATELPHVLLI